MTKQKRALTLKDLLDKSDKGTPMSRGERECLMDMLDDYELGKLVEARRSDLSEAVEVSLDDLAPSSCKGLK